jgi:uncharacterized protein (DUF362 family)
MGSKGLRRGFFVYGLLCLAWLMLRSGLKPSRAHYPCQVAAKLNTELWLATYLLPVLQVGPIRPRLSDRRLVLLVVVALVAGVGYISLRGGTGIDTSLNISNQLQLEPVEASVLPASDIYVVTGTDEVDDGVERLLGQMAGNGLKFYNSSKVTRLSGPEGLISADDVVLIKVNSQWDQRGGTNTDLVKSIIQAIVDHPDGFRGEVVVADNGQAQYGAQGRGGSLDWASNNAQDRGQSIVDVVNGFKPTFKVSAYLWDTITTNVVSEYADGDSEDGYVISTKVAASTSSISAYPKFTTEYGTMISFRHGVYVPADNDYDAGKLKVINIPVLKTHMIYGVTGAVKHYMGVTSDKLTSGLGYSAHGSVGRGGMGTLMAQTRVPDLNILDAIYVNARPEDGSSTTYGDASEVNVIAASTDPVALDYWAAKRILCAVCEANGWGDTSSMDPDNRRSGEFGGWLRLSMEELNAAGYGFTCDEDRISVHVN